MDIKRSTFQLEAELDALGSHFTGKGKQGLRLDLIMKSWSYGTNSIYKKANIYLEEAFWWVFAVDRIAEFLCDLIPSIPLPKIKMRLKDREDIEFNGGSNWTTLRDWYGDLSQVFHCFVHMPVFDFCQKRIRCKSIEIGYNRAREMFYEGDKEFWDEEISASSVNCTTIKAKL